MLKSTSINEVIEKINKDNEKREVPHYHKMNDLYQEILSSKGEFVLVSGSRERGKTGLLLGLVNQALLENKKVDLYTADSQENIVKRLISIRTEIPIEDIERDGLLESSEVVRDALDELSKSNLRFLDARLITEGDMYKSMNHSDGVDLVCIEDMERLLPGEFDRHTTYHELKDFYYSEGFSSKGVEKGWHLEELAVNPDNHFIEDFVKNVRKIAKEKGFAVIGTIEHSWIVFYREKRDPRLEDLRKYGNLEEVPDMIALLFREIVGPEDEGSFAWLDIYYNKGERKPAYISLIWDCETTSFITGEEFKEREGIL